jgi:hypothetical protein
MSFLNDFKNFDLEAYLAREDVRAYIGPHFDYFARTWRMDFAKTGNIYGLLGGAHFNALAFFVGPVSWYGYRKMTNATIMGTVLFAALSFFGYAVSPVWGPLGILIALPLCSFFSNILYFFYVYYAVQARRPATCGGVSALSGFLATFIFMATLYLADKGGRATFAPDLPQVSISDLLDAWPQLQSLCNFKPLLSLLWDTCVHGN